MPKKETTFKETLLKNFPWIVGVLITFLNLWLAYSISPLKQDILNNSFRVSAVEQWLEKHDAYSIRIENKIDLLLNDVAILKARCE